MKAVGGDGSILIEAAERAIAALHEIKKTT
jgi:hypothetical protein